MGDARKHLLTPTPARAAKRSVRLGIEVLEDLILPSASVSGQAFLDANSDGLLNNNESGASGIQVNLESASNQILLSTNTDTNGNYQFSVSSALLSQYGGSGSGQGLQVQIVMPNGFAASPENVSGGGTNSNINAQGDSDVFSLADGGNQIVNAGLTAPSAEVSGEAWEDDGDGILDHGESGASGVTVNLLSAADQVLLSTTTNASGNYQFSVSPLVLLQQGGGGSSGSGSGGDYQIQVVLPSGDAASPENVGGGGTNSNINPDGFSNLFSLQPGGNQVVNAGLAPAPIVDGEVWLDSNDDGTLQDSEAAASGIVVNLTNGSGAVLMTTTTNASGNYQFQVPQSVLDQGNGGQASGLAIQVVVPNGDWTSPENVSGAGIKSNVNSSGLSEEFGLSPGGVQQINAGLVAPAYVGGEIFLDSNSDGLLDGVESGASGVVVHLDNIYGAVMMTTTTDANGNYQFQVGQSVLSQITQSSSSGAQIQVVIPSSEVATVENAAGTGINSNINSSGYSNIFALLGGGNQPINAGLAPAPIVDGEVWLDDGDGILDNGESGLSGVEVELENAGGEVLMNTNTDADGNYLFSVPQSVLNQGNGSSSGSGSGAGWGSGFQIQIVPPSYDTPTLENASGSGINSNINASDDSNVFALPPGANEKVNAGVVPLVVTKSTDDGTGNTPNTLSWAIDQVDSGKAPAGSTITFKIPNTSTITVTGQLPTITKALTINGFSQSGSPGDNPAVELRGPGASNDPAINGLTVECGGVTIEGLAIDKFSTGIVLQDSTAEPGQGDLIEDNYIGTDLTGTNANVGNGIGINVSGSGNTIGGLTGDPTKPDAPGNLIVFNGGDGIQLAAVLGNNNLIQGNQIKSNGGNGISIGSSDNTVGGAARTTDAGNIIAGNSGNGIDISGGSNNSVEGSNISNNTLNGILLENDASGNWIGGIDGGSMGNYPEGNIISGNGQDGVLLTSPLEQNFNALNIIQGNLIGVDSDGCTAEANGNNGVEINQVVGTVVDSNVISGNVGNGLQITGNTANGTVVATQTEVTNNYIGTDTTGSASVYNRGNGIYLYLADQNTIGGTTQGTPQNPIPSNVISGNSNFGIEVASSYNLIVNNYIGTDVTGRVGVGNLMGGINIGWNPTAFAGRPPVAAAAAYNTIGEATGSALGGGLNSTLNIISGNEGDNAGVGYGISMYGGGVNGTVIQGNYIGVDVTGDVALSNVNGGIEMAGFGAPNVQPPINTTIGGTTLAAGNVISANGSLWNLGGAGFGVSASIGSTGLLQNNNIGYDSDEFDPELLINRGGGDSLPAKGWTSTGNVVQ